MQTTTTRIFVALTGLLCSLAVAAQANGAFESAMQKCAAIENQDARLTCFDALATLAPDAGPAKEVAPQPEIESVAPAAAAAAVAPTPAPEVAPVVASEVTAPVPEAPAAAERTQVQQLTDDVGKERVDPDGRENPEYAARVIRCDKNPQSGQLYFFLDNEQVWKQSNYRRVSVGDCRFDVLLSKDTFGYQLYIPGKDRKVRVTRLR